MSKTLTPVHRFLRQPNHSSTQHSRIGNRFNPFTNTLTVLKDPEHHRQLYLIGTTNSSTLLAQRTKKLVQEVKPTSLYVQTIPQWWNVAKSINLTNQQQFNEIASKLPREQIRAQNNLRGILFKLRLYTWLGYLNAVRSFPFDFNLFTPGLQVKYAIQQAEKLGANILFGGTQLSYQTQQALRREPNLYFTNLIINHWTKLGKKFDMWHNQKQYFFDVLEVRGGQAFAESFDKYRANFLVGMFSKLAPLQKKIFIDEKDQDMFYDLYRKCKGEKIVAVVNQWHVTGIESRWRQATKTNLPEQQLSPVADMDIDAFQQTQIINEYLRERNSKLARSEPATHQNYIVQYHKQNFEPERTRHVNHISHEQIPEPGEQKSHGHKKH